MSKKAIIPFTIFALCILCACFANPPTYQRISAVEAYQMMQRGMSGAGSQELNDFVLLDVRTPAEFRESHIPGAILIPVNELEQRAVAELPRKRVAIFVYCRIGARASTAASLLARMGYTQVFNMGGIVDWPFQTDSRN